MFQKLSLNIIVLLCLGSLFQMGQGQTKCKGFEVKPWEKMETVKIECMKQETPNAKSMQEADADACFHRCLNIKIGFVDEGGKINLDNALEYAKFMLPPQLHAESNSKIVNCVQVHGSKVIEMGKTCESYAAVCACIQKTTMEVTF